MPLSEWISHAAGPFMSAFGRTLVLLCIASLAHADDRTIEVQAADELVHCMAVFNWMRTHTEGEKQADVDQWLRSFYGAAKDLTSDEYVVPRFKLESAEFQARTELEMLHLVELLTIETGRCYRTEFSPKVIERLRVLIKTKSSGQVPRK